MVAPALKRRASKADEENQQFISSCSMGITSRLARLRRPITNAWTYLTYLYNSYISLWHLLSTIVLFCAV